MSKLHRITGPDNAKADVIFVHGLGGNYETTWVHDTAHPSDSWPYWMADTVDGVAVHSLEYEASPSHWLGESMPLQDRAVNVLGELEARGIGKRPLVFIGHSLGGLVIKQILLEGSEKAAGHTWRSIVAQTRLVAFLATPHAGADGASWADRLSFILRTTPAIKGLRAHDAHLRKLDQWYRNNSSTWQTLAYFETRRTSVLSLLPNGQRFPRLLAFLRLLPTSILVVPQSDADPKIPRVDTMPYDADHFGICKPTSKDDTLCVLIHKAIDKALGPPNGEGAVPHKMSKDAGQLSEAASHQLNTEASARITGSVARAAKFHISNLRSFFLAGQVPDDLETARDWLLQQGEKLDPRTATELAELLLKAELADSLADRRLGLTPDTRNAEWLLDRMGHLLGERVVHSLSLRAMRALIAYLKDGAQVALEQLADKVDEHSVGMRVLILLEEGQVSQAADLVESRQVDTLRHHIAVRALAAAGRSELANRRRLDATRVESNGAQLLADVAYATGLLMSDASARETAADALKVLAPHLTLAVSRSRIANAVEQDLVFCAMRAYEVLGQRPKAQELSQLAQSQSPLPLRLAIAALNGLIDADPQWPERLRNEHQGTRLSFAARLLAALIQSKCFGKHQSSLRALLDLAPECRTVVDRDDLWSGAFAVAWRDAARLLPGLRELPSELLPSGGSRTRKLEASIKFASGNLEQATTLLREFPEVDDPEWLQLDGIFLLAEGRTDAALQRLAESANRQPSHLLRVQIAKLAYREHRLGLAESQLEAALRESPGDHVTRYNLAVLNLRAGRLSESVRHLRLLHEAAPDNSGFATTLAEALGELQQPDQARRILDHVLERDPLNVEALLLRARLLWSLGQPDNAFESLRHARGSLWSEPPFVALFMQLAFAADQDNDAEQAFARLLDLQSEGVVPQEALKAFSLDEFKSQAAAMREANGVLINGIVSGQCAWTSLSSHWGRPLYAEWHARTRPVRWLEESVVQRSQLTVYSTHGALPASVDDTRRLEELRCPSLGRPVVADLSALITLHELNLLPVAASLFGRVLIPREYLEQNVDESRALQASQLSQRRLAEEIVAAETAGNVTFYPAAPPEAVARVYEYSAEHDFRIADLGIAMKGQLDDDVLGRLENAPHEPARAAEASPPTALRLGADIVTDLATLHRLRGLGWLDAVLRCFRVGMLAQDEAEVRATLSHYESLDRVREANTTMWGALAGDARFEFSALPEDGHPATEPTELFGGRALALARQKDFPLLVDDRWTQAVQMAKSAGQPGSSFGSDCIINAALDEGLIELSAAIDAYLKLIRLRYRFVVVPGRIMKGMADRNRSGHPGEGLRSVARYLHDCMRDPGLLNGPEAVEPPIPISVRLMTSWVRVGADFLALVASDDSYTADDCRSLASWVAREFLPAPCWAGWFEPQMAERIPRAYVAQMLIRFGVSPAARSHDVIKAVCAELAVPLSSLVDLLVSLTDLLDPREDEAAARVVKRYALAALGNCTKLPARDLVALFHTGLTDGLPEFTARGDIDQILRDDKHSARSGRAGPILLIEEAPGELSASPALQYVLAADAGCRESALAYLASMRHRIPAAPGPGSWRFVEEKRSALLDEGSDRWTRVAVDVTDAIDRDWRYQLAGWVQSSEVKLDEMNREFGREVLRPRLETLLDLLRDPVVCFDPSNRDLPAEVMEIAGSDADLRSALDSYYLRFGHLPLRSGSSMSDLVRGWQKERERSTFGRLFGAGPTRSEQRMPSIMPAPCSPKTPVSFLRSGEPVFGSVFNLSRGLQENRIQLAMRSNCQQHYQPTIFCTTR